MFDNLSDKLDGVFKRLKGHGTLTEKNISDGLREVRMALLEADVHFKVVKRFIADIKERALGQVPVLADAVEGGVTGDVEHVPDVPRFMSACASLVRPGGTMFVATINRTLASFALAIVGAEYVLRWLPRGTHRWGWFPRPEELEHHLERAGMPVVARTGVRVNPLTRHFALTSIMAVNYMLVAARPVHGRA